MNESQHDSTDLEISAPLKVPSSAVELLELMEQDPYGALEVIWSMDILSLKTGAKALIEKSDQFSENFKANLLNKLRTEILEPNLCQVIEQDESRVPKIKDLLHMLTTSSFDHKFIKFAGELEPFFDQVVVNVQRYRDGLNTLADHVKQKDDLLAAISVIKKKVDSFKRKTPNVQDSIGKYDQAIVDHKRAIQDLEVEKQMLFVIPQFLT